MRNNRFGRRGLFTGRSSYDEYEEIENEMMDECYDREDAAEWLEDNGYDPDDFDL